MALPTKSSELGIAWFVDIFALAKYSAMLKIGQWLMHISAQFEHIVCSCPSIVLVTTG
jgi:hypothetical protein